MSATQAPNHLSNSFFQAGLADADPEIARAIGAGRLKRFIDRRGRWLALDWYDVEKLERLFGRYSATVDCAAKRRFHGHTSLHTSHPNTQPSSFPASSSGIGPFCSMVTPSALVSGVCTSYSSGRSPRIAS